MKPKISIIICTFNAKDLVKKCLDSIFSQDYPKDKIEIICADGMSKDGTLELLKNYPVKIMHNYKILPEGRGMGKSQAFDLATGDIVGFIDQDNALIEKNYFSRIAEIFQADKEIFGIGYNLYHNKKDNPTNRYLSYIGTDPFTLYLSFDALNSFGLLKREDRGNYYKIKLFRDIQTGGNCFFYRRDLLRKIGGYSQDLLVVNEFIRRGWNKIALPKNLHTHHLTTKGFADFTRKKINWAKKQLRSKQKSDFTYTSKEHLPKLLLELLIYYTLVLNILISFYLAIKHRDSAWLLHPVLSFLVTAVYPPMFLLAKLKLL